MTISQIMMAKILARAYARGCADALRKTCGCEDKKATEVVDRLTWSMWSDDYPRDFDQVWKMAFEIYQHEVDPKNQENMA